jgi:hypothetical protein
MPRRPHALIPLLVVAVLAGRAPAAHAQYRVLETDDLKLHYPAPVLSYLAPYTARCFESSLRFHRKLWDFKSSEKVNVFLDDFGDYGNAGVWVNPRNSMVVHVAPSNFVYETGPSNERIHFTMNHEMVHVLALDQAAGADHLWRGLFRGKVRENSNHPETILYSHLTLPRRAAPRWYHEGIAVFLETWMSGGYGRAQGPYDEMVFRAMVRDSAHFYDPLGIEAEGTRVDFQVGVNSYLYGTRFMTYLAWTYSPEQVLEWVGRHPGSKRYFAAQFRHVFGHPLGNVWADWIRFEHEFQRANLDSLRRYPTTPSRDLSPLALGSVSRAFVDSSSGSLLAAVYRPGAVAHLAAIPLDGGPERMLHEVKGPALYFVSSLAFDPARRQLFFTTDNNEWRDLRVLDLASGREHQLMHDARLGDLTFDRTNKALWAVRHFNGISSLVRLQAPYTEWKLAWSLPFGLDLYDLDVSPDGRTLAASFAEISGRQTLRLMDAAAVATGDTTSLRVAHDFDTAVPSGFTWSPDGRALWGSSYFTGVSNIWRYDVTADSMNIMSNAETGFFRPVPIGDDSLIVFRYSGQGFTPARIRPAPLSDVSAITFLGERLVERRPVLRSWVVPPPSSVTFDATTEAGHPYHALASVRLMSVYPIVEAYRRHTAVGLQAELADPMSFHQFSLAGSYSPDERIPAGQRFHMMARYRRFDLTAQFRWNPASFYDLVGATQSSRKGFGTSIDWHRSLVYDKPRSLELALRAGHWGGLERLPNHQNVATGAGFDQLLDGGAELRYKNLRSSIGASDAELGHQWWLGASVNTVRFARPSGSTWTRFPFVDGGLDVGHPIPGFRNSSVWLRTAAGLSSGDSNSPFANFYFGGFGNNGLDVGEPRRYRDPQQFPGAGIDGIAGTNYARAMLDWNLPALRFRRAGTLALYASWARLSLFGSGLSTNLDGFRWLRTQPVPPPPADTFGPRNLANAGAQVDVRMQLLTQSPLTLSFGWAYAFERGFSPTREWMASLKVL